MKIRKDNQILDVEIEAFCLWDCNKIGINIKDNTNNKLYDMFDLSLEEAIRLKDQLNSAISEFNYLEENYKEYIEEENKN